MTHRAIGTTEKHLQFLFTFCFLYFTALLCWGYKRELEISLFFSTAVGASPICTP